MPRQPRLDIAGGFYHIINRGIERRKIFKKPSDYKMFVKTLGTLLLKEGHKCYAWALMSNHYHLLLERGGRPLSRLMTRLQTTYAGYFNRKYHRNGRFFQNRYKSILCDKESYFLELVAYMHLNPLRAGMVKDMNELKDYPWTGHRAFLGLEENKWQVVDEVLQRFGKNIDQARRRYIEYLKDKSKEKKDLSGGGLIRSAGSLKVVMNRKKDERESYDSRILGDGQFVGKTAKNVEEKIEIEKEIKLLDKERFIEQASKIFGISFEELKKPGRSSSRRVANARALMVYISVEYYKTKHNQWAQYFQISSAAISKLFDLGEQAVKEKRDLVSNFIKLNS